MEPTSEADLADIIRRASEPLNIRGGGTRGISAPSGQVLSTRSLSGIELYEPGALTLVAKAGTPMSEIETALASENQRLPFEPMDHRAVLGTDGVPTIGGVVAANVSGPRRIQVGACRDSLIGVRFVDGQGTVLKNGGRVMKNVTGYDLVKLMAGSYGTLGVLSEVAFKVLPGVGASATLTLRGLPVPQAVQAMSAALGSPFEVSGAAHDPARQETYLRLEGFADSVEYRARMLTEQLASFAKADVISDPDLSAATWKKIRDVEPFTGADGDVWRISVKPSDTPQVVNRLSDAQCLLDWGGGLIWVLAPTSTDVRATLAGIPGHATLVRGASTVRFHPEAPTIAALSATLREKFDPRAILNTGLMGVATPAAA
ncbi:FAD-binding protein [Litoreibacter roseus]|uniref:FAD-binding protein n=1 Tax=Litoreibacter roseus TaxID=2601869 RepID=UPI001358D8BA|nr:FAD-binding protein [Litoreibacter roseus]